MDTKIKTEALDYRNFIRTAYQKRHLKNRLYSMRSYARDLQISPQMLSHVLNGRRRLSPELLRQVANKLKLTEAERREFYYQYFETMQEPDAGLSDRIANDEIATRDSAQASAPLEKIDAVAALNELSAESV